MRYNKVEIYQDSTGQWRWRAIGTNGKTMAHGGESYKRRGTMIRSICSLFAQKLDSDFAICLKGSAKVGYLPKA